MFLRNWTDVDDLFWRPWDDFRRFTDLLASDVGVSEATTWDSATPRVNLFYNDEAVVLTAEAPGTDASTLDISVSNGTLTIKGERRPFELGEHDTTHRRERAYGAFVRDLELPYAIDADKVQASYQHGILAIHLPRAEQDRPRKIQVTAG